MALLGAPRSFLGIDIGTSTIKIVELLDRGSRVELATYALASLRKPLDTQNKTGKSAQEIGHFIAQALDQASASADIAVMSLPNDSILTKLLILPDIAEPQLTNVITQQARQFIPVSLSEIQLVATPAGQTRQLIPLPQPAANQAHQPTAKAEITPPAAVQHPAESESLQPIYVTAVPKELISWYWQVAKSASLQLAALEVELYPLMRAHNFSTARPILFCNLGGYETTLHIASRRAGHLSFTADIGARHFASDPSLLNRLTKDIQKLVKQYEQLTKVSPARSVILGGAATSHVQSFLAGVLPRPISVSHPFRELDIPNRIEQFTQNLGPQFAVAIGLAKYRLKDRA